MQVSNLCNIFLVIQTKYSANHPVRDGFLRYMVHWIFLCLIMIWVPLLIMVTAFASIYFKLNQSIKTFPYLSIQSKVARSRRKVIRMLMILIVVEIICWSPWLIFIITQYTHIKGQEEDDDEQVIIANNLVHFIEKRFNILIRVLN